MGDVFNGLLEAGLIEKLDGNDERAQKLSKASDSLAKKLQAEPRLLLGAILAGLDPNVEEADPAIKTAAACVLAEWTTLRSVYSSSPIYLYRWLLLDACGAVAEGQNAALVWLMAADTLPLMRLGREEGVVRRMLEQIGTRVELSGRKAAAGDGENVAPEQPILELEKLNISEIKKIDRNNLRNEISGASGPNYQNAHVWPNPNPYFPSQNNQWSFEFTNRMAPLLADRFDTLAEEVTNNQQQVANQLNEVQTAICHTINQTLNQHQKALHATLDAQAAANRRETQRVAALWWAQALYSSSLRMSYRHLPPVLAAVVMAVDLLNEVEAPTRASTGHLLSEAVHRLPNASFDQSKPLSDLLQTLRAERNKLPTEWMKSLRPPGTGHFCLRDLLVLALGEQELQVETWMARAGLTDNPELCLPDLAHAMFRQEQALRLCKSPS